MAGIAAVTGQRRLLLDGEIVALDHLGRPSFSRLQQRWPMRRKPSSTLLAQVPVCFFAFDLLVLGDRDFAGCSYVERREALSGLTLSGQRPLVIPPYWNDADPASMLAAAAENGIEGIVSKKPNSQYVPGRSTAWIKSPVRLSCELAIVGWWPPSGPARSGRVGSLLMAGRDADGRPVLVGQVGSGFSDAERRRLYEQLVKVSVTRPLVDDGHTIKGVQWCEPTYVGEVAFREYVPGRGLRHASWKGLREKRFDDVGMPVASPERRETLQ